MRYLVAVIFCLTTWSGYAQKAPVENGVYVQDAGVWTKLYLASAAGTKSSGIAKSAFSYGIAKAKVLVMYRDPEAPVKTSGPRPTFEIVGPTETAPRDIVIVRLQKKKDHRELQVAKVGAFSGYAAEYPPDLTTAVEVKQEGPDMILTPSADLKPGEYILFAGTPTAMPTGYGGYDFSIGGVK